MRLPYNLYFILLVCSCYVVRIQGAGSSLNENSEGRSYVDFLNDVNMKLHNSVNTPDEKTIQLAEDFTDAVYDGLHPIQRGIQMQRRKHLYSKGYGDDDGDLYKHETGESYSRDHDDGSVILHKLLRTLENISSNQTTSKCINDTGRLIIGLLTAEPWALQFIDSAGKPGPALTKLRFNFVGDYDQCRVISVPPANTSDANEGWGDEFDGNYCVISVLTGNPYAMPTIGTCMPNSCSSEELTALMNELENRTLNLTIPIKAECLTAKTEVTTATVFAIIILASALTMMIVGTIYDLLLVSQVANTLPINFNADKSGHVSSESNGNTNANGEATPLLIHSKTISTKETDSPGALGKVFLAFSVYTNGKKILNTSQAPGTLGVIHGIRFLSMSWVVMCHFYAQVLHQLNGLEIMPEYLQRWTFLAISNGFPSVDTFFTLSGLLTSYLTIKEMNRRNSWNINWPMFYFHRFWRLTPPYMFAIVIVMGLTQYLGQGPFWMNQQPADKTFCEKYWWTNLLYVNNLVHPSKMCFGHSWYLANDMQFFVLSPLMIIPFYFHPFAGILSCVWFLSITMITTGTLSSIHDWPTTMISPKHAMSWFSDYYIKPWCRIGPFIIGILAGYILAQTKGRPFKMPWFIALTGWVTAFAAGLAVVYGLRGDISGHDPNTTEVAALYNSVSRIAWGASVSWVIIACSAGYGGPVQSLLSWSPFVFLGRLTYMSYLIHLCIIGVFYGNLGSLLYINDTTVVVMYLGVLVVVNMASFVFVLILESPMVGLERAFLRKERKE